MVLLLMDVLAVVVAMMALGAFRMVLVHCTFRGSVISAPPAVGKRRLGSTT
jgi:hypothetical protein